MTGLSIVVMGAGSIGLYLGGYLSRAGCTVTFIGRARFGDAVRRDGLTLTHFARDAVAVPPTQFDFFDSVDAASQALGRADIVLVCVKSMDSAEAASLMKPHLAADATLVSFQNGVRNPDTLSAVLPHHSIIGAIVPFNVTQSGTAAWHSGTEGALIMNGATDPKITALVDAFNHADMPAKTVDNIAAVQWGKLMVNLNNGLNTLSGGPLKAGLLQRDYRYVLAAMIEEAMSVLAAGGITPHAFGKASPAKMIKVLRLPNFAYRIIMNRILKIDAQARSSMLDDLEAGRACEIDYLQGEIVALAARLGVDAPINAAVKAQVEAAFAVGGSPNLSGAQIRRAVGL